MTTRTTGTSSTQRMTTRSRSRNIAADHQQQQQQLQLEEEEEMTESPRGRKAVRTLNGRIPVKNMPAPAVVSKTQYGGVHGPGGNSSKEKVIQLTSKLLDEISDEDELISVLSAAFSDPCTLARSFPEATTTGDSSVDVQDVCCAYELLQRKWPSKRVQNTLQTLSTNIITTLISEPCNEHNNQPDAVLILLHNPKIIDYTHKDSTNNSYVFPELCSSILNLPSAQQTALLNSFAKDTDDLDARELIHYSFNHYIKLFQGFISREMDKAARRLLPPDSPNTANPGDVGLQKVSLHALNSTSVPLVSQCLSLMNSYNNTHDIVPYSAFYNETVNEHIDIKDDVPRFKVPDSVSFCNYPFLLSPTTKSEIIRIESVISMRTELQDSFFRAMFTGVTCPYLVLEVRRDSLVRDTLYQLDLKLSQDLRKQLKVRFVGEEGVDEGGVQKEFFQLIVRDVFGSKYDMFQVNDESQYYWFSFQNDPTKDALEEMRLVGQLTGLAVYNAVILDLHLPPAIYKKLLDVPVTRDDLREVDPALYHGLTQLLKMTAEDLEALDRSFEVEYMHLGQLHCHELIQDGSNVQITTDNRDQFIDKYVDFIFNTSCEKQFAEFKSGFDRICGTSYVRLMQPRELELLVCGCSDLDFKALEKSTIYDGGYTKDTQVIQHFWKVVGEFTDELRRKLLFFATSSDRVPIGGLSKLHFVIAKNGGDSDRLPTSHTCFNVLLLPEYTTLDKLRERLLTAIHNSEGFGMI